MHSYSWCLVSQSRNAVLILLLFLPSVSHVQMHLSSIMSYTLIPKFVPINWIGETKQSWLHIHLTDPMILLIHPIRSNQWAQNIYKCFFCCRLNSQLFLTAPSIQKHSDLSWKGLTSDLQRHSSHKDIGIFLAAKIVLLNFQQLFWSPILWWSVPVHVTMIIAVISFLDVRQAMYTSIHISGQLRWGYNHMVIFEKIVLWSSYRNFKSI